MHSTKKAIDAVDLSNIPSAFSDASLDTLFDSILDNFSDLNITLTISSMTYNSGTDMPSLLTSVSVKDVILEEPLDNSQIADLMTLSDKISAISSFNSTADHLNETFANISSVIFSELPNLYLYTSFLKSDLKCLFLFILFYFY